MTERELKKIERIFQKLLPEGVTLTVEENSVEIKAPNGCKKEMADRIINYIAGVKYYLAWVNGKRRI